MTSTTSYSAGTGLGAWFPVIALWIAFVLNFADRQVVFSIFPVLKSELGFSDIQLGLTGSMFLWTYALCSPVAGRIADRYSKKWLIVSSVVLWSLSTALTGTARSPEVLLGCRAAIGLTESLFYPAAVALIAEGHTATRSRAIAFFNSGSVIGVVVGGSYGGFVAENYDWRWAFYSLGVAGVLYAIPLRAGLAFLKAGDSSDSSIARANTGSFLRKNTFRTLCLVYTAETFITYLFYTWLATFLIEKFGLGLASAGFTATAYFQGGGIVGLLLGGWLADRLSARISAARLWVLAFAVLLSGPAAFAVGAMPSLDLVKATVILFGICNGAYMANLFASAFEVVAPELRASAAGLMNLVGAAVSGCASLLGGVWKQSLGLEAAIGLSASLCVGAGLALIAAIRLWFRNDSLRADAVKAAQPSPAA